MSSGSAISRPSGQPKMAQLKTQANLKLHGRQPTPDSEALVSSDEEPNLRHRDILPGVSPKPPVRRASWLQSDGPQLPTTLARKGSFAGNSMSPTTSLPPTPSAEPGGTIWGSLSASSTALGRAGGAAPGSGSSYPWNTSSGIWNNDRKDASSRLAEVVPSPTTTVTPNTNSANGLYGGDMNQSSPTTRDQGFTSPIPFQFPLEPSLKNMRSLSYSVGQRDPESLESSYVSSRSRVSRPPYSGLQHRPSRPSMLSEMANDGSALGKVDEDVDDNSSGSLQGSQYMTAEQKKIDQLTRENNLLRQQQQQQRLLRPRASTGASYSHNSGFFSGPLPEESDYAVDELDEAASGLDRDVRDPRREMTRRMSDFPIAPLASPYSAAYEKRNLANAKRGIWQSQLGYNGMGEISQSRRHSFADVPIPQRHNSVVSLGGDSSGVGPLDQAIQQQHEGAHGQDVYALYPDDSSNATLTNSIHPYDSSTAHPFPQSSYASAQPSYASQQQHSALPDSMYLYNSNNKFHGQYHRPISPHRSLYTMQPRPHQSLHIVLFKCNRPDVFYIQEGTGLTVKPGDLVIVEADRGTDLGTVVKDNVDWQTAKELKEHFAEEHYKWLMMYADTAGASLTAASTGATSAVGGMGPPNGHHMQEPNNGELKPKLIKRLAQTHEIQNLRDKEGSEAKAKRLCMQKVKEHNLNMEILDAEFQMDFKKLTFYYFADSYINFNSLVTDLFKIYKTRIWMSAINPASFASPSLGLTAPSGIGPGAVSIDLLQQLQERRQSATQTTDKAPTAPMSGQTGAPRGLRASNSNSSFNDVSLVTSLISPPSYYTGNTMNYPPYNPYVGGFSNGARVTAVGYPPIQPQDHQNISAYAQPNDFQLGQLGRGRFPTSPVGNGYQGQGFSPMKSEQDMFSAFHGLSLNGHQSAANGYQKDLNNHQQDSNGQNTDSR